MTGAQSTDILLAFDFGFRRIGVASGNLRTRTASPVTTLSVGSDIPWTKLDRAITEWQPRQLVVGLPDPEHAEQVATRAREFMDALKKRYELPVDSVDETLTSRAAYSELREARRSGRRTRSVRKELIDSGAACLIAEQWMNE